MNSRQRGKGQEGARQDDKPQTTMPERLAAGVADQPQMLPGSVQEQYICCGKPECHCMKGGGKHGPYYYRIWREGAKVHKVYVRKADLAWVRAACLAYHAIPHERAEPFTFRPKTQAEIAAQNACLLARGQKIMEAAAEMLEASEAIVQDVRQSKIGVRWTVEGSKETRKERQDKRAEDEKNDIDS